MIPSIWSHTLSCVSAMSATRRRTSGSWEYGLPVFIDVRRPTASTASSSARSAIPAYTAASSTSNDVKMPRTYGSSDGPGGNRRSTRSAGAWAPSSIVVRDWEARMPIVSQSSRISKPPPARVTNPCTSRS